MTGETFKEFADSFSYGSRTDLLFKFLKNLPEAAAAGFLQAFLARFGDTLDTGDPQPLFDLLYETQLFANSPPDEDPRFKYDDAPFARLARPLSETRVGLLTSSGHFLEGEDPNPLGVTGMSQEEATKHIGEFGRARAVLSAIPKDTATEKLLILQPGYDIRAAARDRNTVMPIDRMNEFEADGSIGEFASPSYSFMGLTSQLRLTKEVLPEWVERVRADGWEAAVLVPA